MPNLTIQPHLFSNLHLLDPVIESLGSQGFSIHISEEKPDLESFFDPTRGQYDAVKIIQRFEQLSRQLTLICTTVDIYIPIFTFVFGLAKLNGHVAAISTHRLNNKYYGLPEDDSALSARLIKEARHELGHLSGLRHCPLYDCVMASSATAEDIDVKSDRFCSSCSEQFKRLLVR